VAALVRRGCIKLLWGSTQCTADRAPGGKLCREGQHGRWQWGIGNHAKEAPVLLQNMEGDVTSARCCRLSLQSRHSAMRVCARGAHEVAAIM
jgi:hypothetical protein